MEPGLCSGDFMSHCERFVFNGSALGTRLESFVIKGVSVSSHTCHLLSGGHLAWADNIAHSRGEARRFHQILVAQTKFCFDTNALVVDKDDYSCEKRPVSG